MRSPFSPLFLGISCVALGAISAAQSTQAVVLVGGPGSCSSEGTSDPGLLNDDATEASTRLLFTLDAGASQLTLEVENTSPVIAGTPNPLITRVYFNAPAEVTGMTLASQSAAEGVQPAFGFAHGNPAAFSAGSFGSFNALLSGSVAGAIANPDADTVVSDTAVQGPVSFVFDLAGDLGSLTAGSFAAVLSVGPPAYKLSQAAVKFQAGGPDEASAFLNQGTFCDAVAGEENLGGGCGATLTCTTPAMGGICTIEIDGNAPGGRALVMASLPGTPFTYQGCEVFLSLRNRMMVRIVDTDAEGNVSFDVPVPSYLDSPECCGVSFVVQGMVLSDMGPLPLGEITNAVLITLGS